MSSEYRSIPSQRPCRTKIVATLGPASDSEEMMIRLIKAGVDLFRLNFAHSGPAELAPVLARIRKVSAKLGQPIGILADLAGPKMRLGEIPGGEYHCTQDSTVQFIRGKTTSTPSIFTTTYDPLVDELKKGDRVLLADGTVVLQVLSKSPDSVDCKVLQGGVVRSRQGVNLPGVALSIKTLQPKDITNALWATEVGIDFLGLSFVRTVTDIEELRNAIRSAAASRLGTERWFALSEGERAIYYPNIIAKIEKPETLEHLDEIVAAADGIMVARGDLGVEVDIARIAIVQKQIIETCHRKTKPVIVATQMLESMTTESLPTRAEATDVANAILDGTDACMLSGETAIGAHPVLAVEMMNRIARETENALLSRTIPNVNLTLAASEEILKDQKLAPSTRISIAVCDAAGQLAETLGASLICVATRTGRTALNLSKMRHLVMTVGTSPHDSVLRRLCLYWGVIPVGGIPNEPREMLVTLVKDGLEAGLLHAGDQVVLTAGIGTVSQERNAIYVHTVLDS